MYKSVARDLIGPALHIHRQAGFPDLQRRLFIVVIGNPGAGAAMEVRVVHGNLCEVCIGRASEGVGYMAFGGTDSFGMAGRRQNLLSKSRFFFIA